MWRRVYLGTLLFCTPACSQILGIKDFELTDAGVDVARDAPLCYGTSIANFCLASEPSTPYNLNVATLDTGAATSCTQVVTQTGGPELCVIAGTQITVNDIVVATGARPLVLVAADSIVVVGTLDVSSKRSPARVGAGGDSNLCGTATLPGAGAGAGGAAGGTFGSRGASGGLGNNGTTTVARGVAPAVSALTVVHGGCRGSEGGDNSPTQGGPGGAGGGAVYLLAGKSITIAGSIFAAGAGGGAAGLLAGGGGGGSGGLIGLEAPMIDVSGIVSANGGGGSAGASGTVAGGAGSDGTTSALTTQATGGTGGGGTGGRGAAGTAQPTIGANGATSEGGGGGGGGFGFVWVKGALMGTQVSPDPTIN